jgi:hypothetical protein
MRCSVVTIASDKFLFCHSFMLYVLFVFFVCFSMQIPRKRGLVIVKPHFEHTNLEKATEQTKKKKC